MAEATSWIELAGGSIFNPNDRVLILCCGTALTSQTQSAHAYVIAMNLDHAKGALRERRGSRLVEVRIDLGADVCSATVTAQGHSCRQNQCGIHAEVKSGVFAHSGIDLDDASPPRIKNGTRASRNLFGAVGTANRQWIRADRIPELRCRHNMNEATGRIATGIVGGDEVPELGNRRGYGAPRPGGFR